MSIQLYSKEEQVGNFVTIGQASDLGEGEMKHDVKVQVDKISTAAREKIEKAGGTVTLRKARRVEKSEADVVSPEGESDTAAATAKPRVKKTKSRNKKSE